MFGGGASGGCLEEGLLVGVWRRGFWWVFRGGASGGCLEEGLLVGV